MTYNLNMRLTLHRQYIGKLVLYVKIICPLFSTYIPIFSIYLRNVRVASFRRQGEIFINYLMNKETVSEIEATLESVVPPYYV
jgi:hypothetical protein